MPPRRKKVPPTIETAVLTKSGRRCCLCWGLKGDGAVQKGQIAHLDHDPSNYFMDNLAFLCLAHHDEYDSRTSQAKGLTMDEVRTYRDQLYEAVAGGALPTSSPTASAPMCVVTGGQPNITNIQGGVRVHVSRSGGGKGSVVIPGTVAEDHRMYNYLNYLVKRYNEFKKWECDTSGQSMKYLLIRTAYQRELGCAVKDTPQARFWTAVEYLQTRIRNTKLGRIKAKSGQALFSSFEEYRQERC